MRATDGHAYGFTRSRVHYGFPGSLPVEEVPEYQHSPTRATNNLGSKYSKGRSEPQNPYYPTYCPENEELYYHRTTKSAKKHDDARRKVTCSISAQPHPHRPAPCSRLFRLEPAGETDEVKRGCGETCECCVEQPWPSPCVMTCRQRTAEQPLSNTPFRTTA